MLTDFFKLLFILACLATAFAVNASAQMPDASSASGRNDGINQRDLPESMQELLVKQRIKAEEKEFQQLVERGEEAAKLGEELGDSMESNQKLSSDDLKKLDRLEKLVKKIRSELGAESDDSEDSDSETSPNLNSTVKNIRESSANLLSEIKKIGRHTVSVVAIESSNSLLQAIKFLRFNKN